MSDAESQKVLIFFSNISSILKFQNLESYVHRGTTTNEGELLQKANLCEIRSKVSKNLLKISSLHLIN